MPATKTKKKPVKPRKPKRTHQLCCGCMRMKPVETITPNENGSPRCDECMPQDVPVRKVTKKEIKDSAPKPKWFVLTCQPGEDGRVKKALVRKAKIESMTAFIKRVVIPRAWRELVVPKKGDVVAEGTEESDARTCHLKAQAKCRELAGLSEGDPDETGILGGYRYSVYQPKSKEPGKESNNWTWKVRTVPPEKESKILQVKKYPGYLICQLIYNPEVDKIIKGLRNSWGLLLPPVVTGHRRKVYQSKLTGLWRWNVKTPDGKRVISKGGPHFDRRKAEGEADTALSEAEEFKPTALKTREEAELVIAQKVYNQLKGDKKAREKRTLAVRKGDPVKVIDGAWRGAKGVVIGTDKKDPSTPLIVIKTRMLEVDLEISVPHYEVEYNRESQNP